MLTILRPRRCIPDQQLRRRFACTSWRPALELLERRALLSDFTLGPPVPVSGRSPFADITADNVAGQPGINFANSEVEPYVAVDPTNPSHLVGSWQQDRWSNGGSRGLVAGVSLNGGGDWQEFVIPKISLASGGNATNGGDFQRVSDPWISFAPNGDLYQISLALDITPPSNRPGGNGKNAVLVSKSTDDGQTWSDPITLIRDEDPRFLNDKESITADPTNSNNVYAVWDRLDNPLGVVINPEHVFGLGFKGPAMFARTTDGGMTWEPARIIYNPGANNQTIGNQIVVLPDGTLVDAFNEILNFKNSDGGSHFDFNLSLIRSTDQGATWTHGPAIRAAKIQSVGVTDPDTGHPVRTGDILPEIAADRNQKSPGFGNLYAVWQDASFNGVDQIAFSMSSDGGFHWSTPIKINQTPSSIPLGNQQAFNPSIQVAADGTVGVTYYDFRNNTMDPKTLLTDYWIVHAHPSGPRGSSLTDPRNWGDELRLTTSSFDMEKAPDARGFFVGDYEGLAAVGNDFMAFFSQPQGSDPANITSRRVVAPDPAMMAAGSSGRSSATRYANLGDIVGTPQEAIGFIPDLNRLTDLIAADVAMNATNKKKT